MLLHKRIKNTLDQNKKEIEKNLLMSELKMKNQIDEFNNNLKQIDDFKLFVEEFEKRVESQKQLFLSKIKNV